MYRNLRIKDGRIILDMHITSTPDDAETPLRKCEYPSHVRFDKSLYMANEKEKLESYVTTEFEESTFNNYFTTQLNRRGDMFHFPYIHFAIQDGSLELPGLCDHLGLPHSVIGRRQLYVILRHPDIGSISRKAPTNWFTFWRHHCEISRCGRACTSNSSALAAHPRTFGYCSFRRTGCVGSERVRRRILVRRQFCRPHRIPQRDATTEQAARILGFMIYAA